MRIRMLTMSAGPRPEDLRHPGKIYEVPKEEGELLIESNHAAPVEAPRKVERAVRAPAEKAVGGAQQSSDEKKE